MECLIGKTLFDNRRNITVISEKYVKKNDVQPNGIKANSAIMWYKYKCNICGWEEGWVSRGGMISQCRGCSCCANQTLVIGINDFNTKHPHLVKFLKNKKDGENFATSGGNVGLKCTKCGYEKNILLRSLARYGYRCDRCEGGDSYPNKFMKSLLEQLNISYKKEYSPKWISPKRYDFYIPNLKLIIEMDGLQHERNTNFNGTKTFSKDISENDAFKEKIALENGLHTVRIVAHTSTHSEIKKNIFEKLSSKLDLSKVDWEMCELHARDSIVKKVCEFKKTNPFIFSSELSKIFDISQSTITRYLYIGNEIGWCKYSPKDESERNIKYSTRRSKSNAQKVVVFTKEGDQILGVFNSALELEQKSKKIFGVVLKQYNTRYCCKHKSKRCMGFKVRYYNDVFDTVATTE